MLADGSPMGRLFINRIKENANNIDAMTAVVLAVGTADDGRINQGTSVLRFMSLPIFRHSHVLNERIKPQHQGLEIQWINQTRLYWQ